MLRALIRLWQRWLGFFRPTPSRFVSIEDWMARAATAENWQRFSVVSSEAKASSPVADAVSRDAPKDQARMSLNNMAVVASHAPDKVAQTSGEVSSSSDKAPLPAQPNPQHVQREVEVVGTRPSIAGKALERTKDTVPNSGVLPASVPMAPPKLDTPTAQTSSSSMPHPAPARPAQTRRDERAGTDFSRTEPNLRAPAWVPVSFAICAELPSGLPRSREAQPWKG